jgi:hypothetical protein
MSAKEIVVGSLGALLGLAGVLMLPLVWRGWLARREVRFRGRLYTHGDAAFMFWGGPIFRRGLARAFLPLLFAWGGGIAGYWVAMLNGGGAGAGAPHAAEVAGVVTAAWFMAWFVLAVSIVLFNWPKLMVPPGQRSEPGAIAEWRSARRKKRQGPSRSRTSARR